MKFDLIKNILALLGIILLLIYALTSCKEKCEKKDVRIFDVQISYLYKVKSDTVSVLGVDVSNNFRLDGKGVLYYSKPDSDSAQFGSSILATNVTYYKILEGK